MITLHVVSYEDVWREGARDAKTLAAWALYEGLNREGAIKDAIKQAYLARQQQSPNAEEDEDEDAEEEEDATGGAEDESYKHETTKRQRTK